jgi:hypothetical protein
MVNRLWLIFDSDKFSWYKYTMTVLMNQSYTPMLLFSRGLFLNMTTFAASKHWIAIILEEIDTYFNVPYQRIPSKPCKKIDGHCH